MKFIAVLVLSVLLAPLFAVGLGAALAAGTVAAGWLYAVDFSKNTAAILRGGWRRQ